jgi:O-acetyl-ADP-ribose deacetylase (regulator of RNase III)
MPEGSMENIGDAANPTRIHVLDDLALALDRLRRAAAQEGQLQVPVRYIAAAVGRAPSTIQPYLRGQRLCPPDIYEDILRALGVTNDRLRPWLEAWERIAEGRAEAPKPEQRPPRPILFTSVLKYRVDKPARSGATVNIVTGDIRRVRFVEIWVNPENTNMAMPRFEEFSTSAIIRFEGAVRDRAGHVIVDVIADELAKKVTGRTPVAPGTAISTGSGELRNSNGVHNIIHVAAVHGEPGEGYRAVSNIGRCVINAMAEADRLRHNGSPVRSILFPLLGTGVGGGSKADTIMILVNAAVNQLVEPNASISPDTSGIRDVYFLAYTDQELALCTEEFDRNPRLIRESQD